MLIAQGITPRTITSKNPQANAISERSHHTIGAMMRTQLEDVDVENIDDAEAFVDSVLASVRYAMRSLVHRTLGVSPGAIIFGRDMLLNLPVVANWEQIRQRKQAQIDYDAARENRRRYTRDYQPGDEVLVIVKDPTKMEDRMEGPYTVTQVFNNGTVAIQRTPNVVERINVRRIKPYERRDGN